jgi:hypothetical protein
MKLEAKQRLLAADELTPKQKQLDINGDGKISSDDLKRLREGEKPEEVEAAPLTYGPASALIWKAVPQMESWLKQVPNIHTANPDQKQSLNTAINSLRTAHKAFEELFESLSKQVQR